MKKYTIESINNEIQKLQSQIEELEKQKKTLLNMSLEHRIAVELHSLLCKSNHEDQCGWYYEIKNNEHNWNGYAHLSYYGKAVRFLNICKKYDFEPDKMLELYRELLKL